MVDFTDVGEIGVFIDRDRNDLSRAEGVGDVDRRVFVPFDDVDLFILQFRDDVLDARAFRADAGTDGIDIGIAGIDGDLRTAARFAGDGFQFDDAFVDFRYFQFKEAL